MKPHPAVFLLSPEGVLLAYIPCHANEILKSRNTVIDIGTFA